MEFIDKDFHSRFSAKKRSYRYIISQKENMFLNDYMLYKKNIDIELIQKAIKEFEGTHNFEYFKKNGSINHTHIRHIYQTKVIKYKHFVIIKFIGNGFLRSQIRMMVDFLLKINDKKLTIKHLQAQLNREKIFSTTLAKAGGLYFERIYY